MMALWTAHDLSPQMILRSEYLPISSKLQIWVNWEDQSQDVEHTYVDNAFMSSWLAASMWEGLEGRVSPMDMRTERCEEVETRQ
jgi:hypothetical protein